MMASLFAGVSGLKNHQVRMNVIGNNIANINTIGYKASRVNFQEALVQTFRGAGRPSATSGGTNPVQLGLGMQVAAIDTLFQQGGLETTGQITDLAIQGSGFFVLGDTNGNKFYTRAGAFGFDANSNLVDPATGMFVLGKNADSSGEIPSLATTGPITIPFGQQDPARSTEEISLSNNIDSTATTAYPSLLNTSSSGVTLVSGLATNGVGGSHSIVIEGNQSTASSINLPSSISPTMLTNSTTLTDLGVTDFSDMSISVDGSGSEIIRITDGSTTVGEIMDQINELQGITAKIDEASGNLVITRDFAGSQSDYNIEISGGVAGSITTQLFGAAADTPIISSGGAASDYVATDTFTPTHGTSTSAGPFESILGLDIDSTTGLVIGLTGLGGGGVEIKAEGGLEVTGPLGTNPLVIETADTTHSTSIAVFDSLGAKHILSLEFFKSGLDNRWEWEASALDGENITSGQSGYIQFNGDASLNSFSYNGGANSMTIDPGNGADTISLTVDAGTPNGFDGLTGFESPGGHTASIISQDGYGLGLLDKIAIDQVGNISGFFSNGVTRVLAQISLADFSNQAGLRKVGNSRFQVSANSGEAIEGIAGATVSGLISSGALEASSVDIAQEFTTMITAQRGFQANSRIITTSDSMLEELVNIKR